MINKVMKLSDAVGKIKDGATIMIGGFGITGRPLKCVEYISENNIKDLTVICISGGQLFGPNTMGMHAVFAQRLIKKYITTHIGTSPPAIEAYLEGQMEVEYSPMGTFVERIRAGGAGLGGILTPTGVGTLIAEGKKVINIDGKDYLLELPLRASFSLVKGYRADTFGNIEYRGNSMTTNIVMAMASDYTIAEVNEIVEPGEIPPDRVDTPGIFVKAVVQGYSLAEQEKMMEEHWLNTGFLK